MVEATIVNETKEEKTQTLGIWSIVLAALSMIPLFIFLALPAFILGVIGTAKKEGPAAITGLILSIVLPWVGLIFFISAMLV